MVATPIICYPDVVALWVSARMARKKTLDLGQAAARHRRCAQRLADHKEHAEACYLIGLAAECAVKHHMQQTGFPLVRSSRSRKSSAGPDPLFLHFPELATELLLQAEGILSARVLARIREASFLAGWQVKMRYLHQPSSPAIVKQYLKWCAVRLRDCSRRLVCESAASPSSV